MLQAVKDKTMLVNYLYSQEDWAWESNTYLIIKG